MNTKQMQFAVVVLVIFALVGLAGFFSLEFKSGESLESTSESVVATPATPLNPTSTLTFDPGFTAQGLEAAAENAQSVEVIATYTPTFTAIPHNHCVAVTKVQGLNVFQLASYGGSPVLGYLNSGVELKLVGTKVNQSGEAYYLVEVQEAAWFSNGTDIEAPTGINQGYVYIRSNQRDFDLKGECGWANISSYPTPTAIPQFNVEEATNATCVVYFETGAPVFHQPDNRQEVFTWVESWQDPYVVSQVSQSFGEVWYYTNWGWVNADFVRIYQDWRCNVPKLLPTAQPQ